MRALNPHRDARDARARAVSARAQALTIRDLPVEEASRLIEATRAEQERIRQQTTERAQRLGDPFEPGARRADPSRDGPTRSYERPETDDIAIPRVLFALSEPLRLNMVRMLAERGEVDSIELGPDLPRSTLTHHTSLLRESGVVFVRGEGRKCMIQLRTDDLDQRFPGLIDTVLNGYDLGSDKENGEEEA